MQSSDQSGSLFSTKMPDNLIKYRCSSNRWQKSDMQRIYAFIKNNCKALKKEL